MCQVLSMEQLGSLLRKQAEDNTCPAISAIISTDKEEYSVKLEELGPDTVLCSDCPRILPGTTISLRLDEEEGSASYLFNTSVTASSFDAVSKRWKLELALIGSPVVLSWGRGRAPSSAAVLRLERDMRAA